VQVQHFLSSAVGAAAGATERSLLAAASAATGAFAVGDAVMVTTGDLKSMKGKVVDVEAGGETVYVLPALDYFSEKLPFPKGDLQKHVDIGTRVRVRLRRRQMHSSLSHRSLRVLSSMCDLWGCLALLTVQRSACEPSLFRCLVLASSSRS
jgi:hypothetical protein